MNPTRQHGPALLVLPSGPAVAVRAMFAALALAGFASIATPAVADEPKKEIFEQLLDKLHEKGILSDEEVGQFKQAREEEKREEAQRIEQVVKDAQPPAPEPQPMAAQPQPAPVEAAAGPVPVPAVPAPAKETKCGPDDPDGYSLNVCPTIKSAILDGDVRLRYESRQGISSDAKASPNNPYPNTIQRDRWRYAFRLGLSGDVNDSVYYGLRVETGTNPRSSWNTFGSNAGLAAGGTDDPFSKTGAGLNLSRIYAGAHVTPWLNIQAGKMPNPLYTTSMVWDPDLQPEGFAERISYAFSNGISLFMNFGQFVYQDANPDLNTPGLGVHRQDAWLYASQVGLNWKLTPETSVKAAVSLMSYNKLSQQGGSGDGNGLNGNFSGEGRAGAGGSNNLNVGGTGFANNQTGLNDLRILEVPFEVNFPLLGRRGRFFGDMAINLDGGSRARNAGALASGGQGSQYQDDRKAFQFGLAYGTMDLSTGGTRLGKIRAGVWEARAFWQRVQQYALDPNLTDSDFMEGRTNLQGLFTAIAYSPADTVITTARFGYAHRVNDKLGTGGANPDLPQLNPITDYRVLQFDLTWKF